MESDKAYELADGLHKLADFISSQHESLPNEIDFDISTWLYAGYGVDNDVLKPQFAGITRAALTQKATITKEYTSFAFRLLLGFGPLTWTVASKREAVCTAQVVSQETYEVEEQEGEDLRPTVTVVKTKDIIEWKCDPVLERLVDTA